MPFDQAGFTIPQPHLPAPVPTVADVLRAGRAAIANIDDWWQEGGHNGQCGAGKSCIALAVVAAARKLGYSDPIVAVEPLKAAVGGELSDVFRFNDTHTHADVLSLFDRAIAAAESQS